MNRTPFATAESRRHGAQIMAWQARQIAAGALQPDRATNTCKFCAGDHSCKECPHATDEQKRNDCP